MPVKPETSGSIELDMLDIYEGGDVDSDMLQIIAGWTFVLVVAICLGAL